MTKDRQKIRQIIPKTNGIFSHMQYVFRAELTKANLDLMFYANYGLRSPSPIVEAIQDEPGEVLTKEEVLKNASDVSYDQVRVKKVI